jgi:hypothetical protein
MHTPSTCVHVAPIRHAGLLVTLPTMQRPTHRRQIADHIANDLTCRAPHLAALSALAASAKGSLVVPAQLSILLPRRSTHEAFGPRAPNHDDGNRRWQ